MSRKSTFEMDANERNAKELKQATSLLVFLIQPKKKKNLIQVLDLSACLVCTQGDNSPLKKVSLLQEVVGYKISS